MKNLNVDIRFIDESHNGGTTELAKKTLETYGKDSITIQITATYSKPTHSYNIPIKNWILWKYESYLKLISCIYIYIMILLIIQQKLFHMIKLKIVSIAYTC